MLWILVGNGFIRHYPLLSASDSNMASASSLLPPLLLIVLLLSHLLLLRSSYFLKWLWCHEIAIPWFLAGNGTFCCPQLAIWLPLFLDLSPPPVSSSSHMILFLPPQPSFTADWLEADSNSHWGPSGLLPYVALQCTSSAMLLPTVPWPLFTYVVARNACLPCCCLVKSIFWHLCSSKISLLS
jgi:hypothetical protein